MQRLTNLTELYLDARGALLDAGKIYIGVAGQDPEAHPATVYWDAALSVPAPQPLRTLGGVIVNGESPTQVYLADGDYSQRVRDVDSLIVAAYTFSSASAVTGASGGGGATYQPLDSDLTAIAALATTPFGRNLLTLANLAALKALIGNAGGLATTGGSMTGDITRTGAGVYPYFADVAMIGGRIFVTAEGASDPTSQPGDLWFTY